jgi:hypothetical protein
MPQEFIVAWDRHEDFLVASDGSDQLVVIAPSNDQQSPLCVTRVFDDFRQAAIWQFLEVDLADWQTTA